MERAGLLPLGRYDLIGGELVLKPSGELADLDDEEEWNAIANPGGRACGRRRIGGVTGRAPDCVLRQW